MSDNLNRISDFQSSQPTSVNSGSRIAPADLKNSFNAGFGKVREMARANPAKFLGGLAALAIGAGLMRRGRM